MTWQTIAWRAFILQSVTLEKDSFSNWQINYLHVLRFFCCPKYREYGILEQNRVFIRKMKDNRHKSKYFISCMSKHKINHHLIFFRARNTHKRTNDVRRVRIYSHPDINFSYFSYVPTMLLLLLYSWSCIPRRHLFIFLDISHLYTHMCYFLCYIHTYAADASQTHITLTHIHWHPQINEHLPL